MWNSAHRSLPFGSIHQPSICGSGPQWKEHGKRVPKTMMKKDMMSNKRANHLWRDGVGASDQSPIPSEIRQWLIMFTMIAIHLPLLSGPARVALEHEMLAPNQATARHCGQCWNYLTLCSSRRRETGCAIQWTTNHSDRTNN